MFPFAFTVTVLRSSSSRSGHTAAALLSLCMLVSAPSYAQDTSTRQVGNSAVSAAQIADPRTTGRWHYREWGSKGPTRDPWRNAATVLPNAFTNLAGSAGDQWNMHSRLREKMQRLLDLFASAAPNPPYSHHMAHVFSGRDIKKGELQNRLRMTIGDFHFKYDVNGMIVAAEPPIGGFNPDAVGAIYVNGPTDVVGIHGTSGLFAYAEGLSVKSGANRELLPTGKLFRVPPAHRGADLAKLSKAAGAAVSFETLPIKPKGMEQTGFLFTRSNDIKSPEGSMVLETEYWMVWTASGKLPISNFVTRGQILNNFHLIATTVLAEAKARGENQVGRDTQRVELIEKLRRQFESSLHQVAVIPDKYRDEIEQGMFFQMISEESGATRGARNRITLPLDGFFVDDPMAGHRFGQIDMQYYAGLAPGEIRSIQFETKIRHRFANDPQFGKPTRAGWPTFYADASGNIRNTLIYNFPWSEVKALLVP